MKQEAEVKKIINCSFCNKGRHQVEQMIEGPVLNGQNIYICNECVDVTYEILHTDEEAVVKKKKEKLLIPEQIKAHLDEYIIGQDDAKIAISVAVYNHYKRINSKDKTEIEKSNLLMIGSSGSGKAQPLYSKIKIPGGWTTMGEIRVGDVVSTPDGKTADVVGIFPQGKKDIYRVTFADGRTAESCDEHLWEVYTNSQGDCKWKVQSLREIIDSGLAGSEHGIYIRLIEPEQSDDSILPVEPYVLGAFIGDKFVRSKNDSSALISEENFINERVLLRGHFLKYKDRVNYSLKDRNLQANKAIDDKTEFKKVGPLGKKSVDKFIPEIYKSSSTRQKLELLSGLIGAGGIIYKDVISYSTISRRLATDIQDLVRSLGGIAKVHESISKNVYKGIKKEGLKLYKVIIRFKDLGDNFSLSCKQHNVFNYKSTNELRLKISNIEYIGKEDAKCILINHPDHLYITDNYVVTHNTLTVKTVAKLFDLPYVIADATSLTEAGYVGEAPENLIKRLISDSNNNIEKAQKGIIFIDEIDKKSRSNDSSSSQRDVSGEGVQQALLKMIEGTVVKIEDEFRVSTDFDTKDVLFICSGAFVGLDEITRKNKSKSSIGIGAQLNTRSTFSQTVKSSMPEDFIKYGLIPEFVGRCPVVVVFDDLTPDIMIRILKEPKNSIVSQFKSLFKYEGVTLDFDDKYLLNVAEECLKQKVGARGLRSIIEKHLQQTQFILPSLAKKGVNKIFVDANGTIKHVYKAKKRATNE